MPCFYKDSHGNVVGPISSADARRLAAQNVITRSTPMAKLAEGPWVAAGRLRGLFETAPEAKKPLAHPVHSTPTNAPSLTFVKSSRADNVAANSPVSYSPPPLLPQRPAWLPLQLPQTVRELAERCIPLARQHIVLLCSVAGVACLLLVGAVAVSSSGNRPAGDEQVHQGTSSREQSQSVVAAENNPSANPASLAVAKQLGSLPRGGASATNALELIPSDSKLIGVVYPRVLFQTEFGKNNVRSMMATPAGQEGLRQIAEIEAKYGVAAFFHVTQFIVAAPCPRGEILSGLLFILEGEFNRARIEQVLANFDGLPNESQGGVNVFQSNGFNGSGQFYFAFLSDSLLVASMELPAVRAAISRSGSPPDEPFPEALAAALGNLPSDKTAWLVMDPTAITNQSPDIRSLCDRASWLSLSVDAVHPTGSLLATIEAKTPRDAEALADRFRGVLHQNANGEQMLRMLPGGLRPASESISVGRNGRRVVVSVSDLQ